MASQAHQTAVKQLLIDRFRLRMTPDQIADDEPLFGEGLGLDSVDAIELVTGLREQYGIELTDEARTREVMASVATLAEFLEAEGALS